MSQHDSNTSFPEKSQTNSPEQESSSNSPNDNQKVFIPLFYLVIFLLGTLTFKKKKTFFFSS